MSEIVLRQISPLLAQKLQQRAARNGHSIEDEILLVLHAALNVIPKPAHDLVSTIEQRFASFGSFEIPETPREPIQTDPMLFAE